MGWAGAAGIAMMRVMRETPDSRTGTAPPRVRQSAEDDRTRLHRAGSRQAAAMLLAAAIFVLDSFSQLSSAVATLYLLVLLIASGSSGARLLCWSIGCAGLTLAGMLIAHGVAPPIDTIVRMLVSLATNAATTGLLLHRQAMDRRVAHQERRYATMMDSLAVAIWEHDFRPVTAAIAGLRAEGVVDLAGYLRANPDFVAATQRRVRITDVNQTALTLMGVPNKQAFFRKLVDFLPDADASFAACILAIDEQRPMFQAESRLVAADGTSIDVIVAFSFAPGTSLDRVPGSILDIRQHKRLQATVERTRIELERVQRTVAIGAMSASIAHEINQPIAAIQSYADSARRWLARPEPDLGEVRRSLAGLDLAVTATRDVMHRVRNLVGGSRAEIAPLLLETLVSDTVAIAARDVTAHGATIRFTKTGTAPIRGDSILLKHLLLNLITNALQAMEAAGTCDPQIEVAMRALPGCAQLEVRDSGPGLATSAADTPFETFYTTKPGGMGLGLTICRSIIDLHEGRIDIANHPEGGAMVSIALPLATDTPCISAAP